MRYAVWTLTLAAFALGASAVAHAQEPVAEEPAGLEGAIELPEPPKEKQGWEPKGELAELLERMGDATAASREVFAPLSAKQLNWRPPNGTHTARWNAEHLGATQLRLFSEVYAALDPDNQEAISVGPKQMPDDYVALHPEWTGADEAEQMERINDYCQGFAYLVEDVDLDEPVEGTRWSPRKLMDLMVRHYEQHTANVQAKFGLPGWPKD